MGFGPRTGKGSEPTGACNVTCSCFLSQFPATTHRISPEINSFIAKLVFMHVIFSKFENS